MKIGRNDPCHCGSGQKYKKCHLPTDEAAERAARAAAAPAPAEDAPVAEAPAGDAPAGAAATRTAGAPARPAGTLGGRAKLPPAPPPAPARRRAV